MQVKYSKYGECLLRIEGEIRPPICLPGNASVIWDALISRYRCDDQPCYQNVLKLRGDGWVRGRDHLESALWSLTYPITGKWAWCYLLPHDCLFNSLLRPTSKRISKLLIAGPTLRWRHNGHDCVSNHQPRHCLLDRLFERTSKKTSKLRATGLCVENSPGTGEFPAQMASYAENVSIWWRHHVHREIHWWSVDSRHKGTVIRKRWFHDITFSDGYIPEKVSPNHVCW